MRLTVLLLLLGGAAAAQAPSPALVPYEMDWKASTGVLADVSSLLDAPAGHDGFIHVENGRLVDGRGRRFRIWGVNFSFVASLPPKDLAPAVAAHLARFGVNCVRVHHLDWRAPRGIIDSRYPDSSHLDPDALDRLDFFVNELKKRGIYTNLNLNVARAFQEADGVRDAGQLGFAKALTQFDDRMIELQRDYARQLLTHRNPYTGAEYRNEPAIAIVEIVNENSIIESWARGRLLGKGPAPGQTDMTWVDIPDSYERDLTTRYNTWLERTLRPEELARIRKEAGAAEGQPIPRLRPDQFAAASPERFRTEANFYITIEAYFYARMGRYLKDGLGVKAPVIGTSAHNGGLSPYPLLSATSQLDIVDTHTYWQHPSYTTDPATKRRGFTIRNTPMVNEPEKSTVVTLHRAAIDGKPFTVSEVNHPYPSEWAAEMIPILAAYGSFLDWDGIFWYSFEHASADNWVSKYPSHFDIRQDPVKMSQLAAAALMFQRADITQAAKTIPRAYTADFVRDSLRMPSAAAPNFTPSMPATLALRHATRITGLRAQKMTEEYPQVLSPIVSDTGQLTWSVNEGKGVVTVDAPNAQALIGFLKSRPASLANLAAEIDNEFAAIMAVSMDGRAIASSASLLVTAGARTGNSGMKWNEKRTTLVETGSGPMMIEPVTGHITLKSLNAKSVKVQPLDGGGCALGPVLRAEKRGSDFRFPIGKPATPWYLVRVAR